MNKAELKAKADEYFNCVNCHSYADTREDLQEDVTQAYIAGYEARNGEVKILKEKIHWWKKEVNVAHRAREDEFEKLVIENKALKEENEKLQLLLDVQNFLIEPKNKEKKEHLKQNGWVEITMPCSKEDARDCLTKQEGLCESTDGLCRIKINLSSLCKC